MYGFHYFPIVTDLLLILGGGLLSCFFVFVKKQGRFLGNSMRDSLRNQMVDENAACYLEKLFNRLYRCMIGLGIFIILLGILNLATDCLRGPDIIKTMTCCFLFAGFVIYGIMAGTIFREIYNALKSQETDYRERK